MNKHILKKGISLLIVSTLCATPWITANANEKLKVDTERISQKIKLIENIVDEYYLFEKNTSELEEGIYKGFIEALGDKHSVYIPPEEKYVYTDSYSGFYNGIGAEIEEQKNGYKMVTYIVPNSSAEKSGIKVGDIIYSVDGKIARDLTVNDVVNNVASGKVGEAITFEIYDEKNNELKKINIVREKIKVVTVEHKMLANKIAYIYISEFTNSTYEDFKKAIEDLKVQGMTKLVIDIRSNPGGTVESVIKILAYILPEKEYLNTVNKQGEKITYYSKDGKIISEQKPHVTNDEKRLVLGEDNHQLDIPISVLVDGNSASASEVLAGTLKDYKRATIVGEKTYGKGIVQNIFELSDGSAVKLTVSYYYTPNGISIQNKGIEPDIKITFDSEAFSRNIDVQLNAAIKSFN